MFVPKLNKDNFREKVELLVIRDSISYIDAIVQICDEFDIQYEDVAILIPSPMKDKLEVEARARNIIPRINDITAFFNERVSS